MGHSDKLNLHIKFFSILITDKVKKKIKRKINTKFEGIVVTFG